MPINGAAVYQRGSIASYTIVGIVIAEMSVHLSVRLSHSGIVSKRTKIGLAL